MIVLVNERRLLMWKWQNTFIVIALHWLQSKLKISGTGRGDAVYSKWLNFDDWLSDFAEICHDGALSAS